MRYQKLYETTTLTRGEPHQKLPFFLTGKQWERVEKDAKKAQCTRSEMLRRILIQWFEGGSILYPNPPQTERTTQVKCPLPLCAQVYQLSSETGIATSTLIKSALIYHTKKGKK
jgi:hypothetical protein